MEEAQDTAMTQKLTTVKHIADRAQAIPETPVPGSASDGAQAIQVRYKRVASVYPRFIPSHDAAKVHLIEEQCRRVCLSLFFREQNPVRTMGITSSIPGEGKSFVAIMMAHVLANDSTRPVTLIECDWEHPSLHDYFGFLTAPGLAEWLRGECAEADIRHKVNGNLTIIRAGDGQQDAVRLLQQITKSGLRNALAHDDENLLIDLPPMTTTSYSVFAASMVDALALVVRAGVTPDSLVADACAYLNNLPMVGIILNQVVYHPRSLRLEGKSV